MAETVKSLFGDMFRTPEEIRQAQMQGLQKQGLLNAQSMRQNAPQGRNSGLAQAIAGHAAGIAQYMPTTGESMRRGLLGGAGMAAGIAGNEGLQQGFEQAAMGPEEAQAKATQDIMRSADMSSVEGLKAAQEKFRAAGNARGVEAMQQKIQQLEALEMQKTAAQSNLDTAKLGREQLRAQIDQTAEDRKRAETARANALKTLQGMKRPDLAGYVEAGMSIDKAFEIASVKTKPIKVSLGNGKDALLDPTTYEVLWQPQSAADGGVPEYTILGQAEMSTLAEQTNTDLTGAIIERNTETNSITIKKQPNTPPTGLRDQYNIEVVDGEEVWTPKKGTPAYDEMQTAKKETDAKREANRSLTSKIHSDVTTAMSIADSAMTLLSENVTVGGVGSLAEAVPGSPQANFKAYIDTLKSGKSLEAYRAAKDAGVSFGSTTTAEWELLASQAQNLETAQGRKQLMGQLEAFELQQMNALGALVSELSVEELASLGLGNLEFLRQPNGQPWRRIEVDEYPDAKAFFNAKNKVAAESRKIENRWALDDQSSNVQTQAQSWMSELDAMEGM